MSGTQAVAIMARHTVKFDGCNRMNNNNGITSTRVRTHFLAIDRSGGQKRTYVSLVVLRLGNLNRLNRLVPSKHNLKLGPDELISGLVNHIAERLASGESNNIVKEQF